MMSWRGQGRRGRPANERPTVDQGTPELQAHRAARAAGGDPALSEFPLGMMLARGQIGPEQLEAGCYYAFLYGRTIGHTQPSCSRYYEAVLGKIGGRAVLDDAAQAKIQALYRLGKNRLLAASRRVCDATENLAVFGRSPRFLDPGRRVSTAVRRADCADLQAVLDGLDILVACYGRAAGRSGRMDLHQSPSLRTRSTVPLRA